MIKYKKWNSGRKYRTMEDLKIAWAEHLKCHQIGSKYQTLYKNLHQYRMKSTWAVVHNAMYNIDCMNATI